MFVLNDDLSIYATRGDVVFFAVTAEQDGITYHFQPGDIVRIKIFGKKDAETVYLQKDFPVTEVTDKVEIFLEEQDTKIGDCISKPRDYWYEIELNPGEYPQTIIGYDEDGAKVFKLFPEGDDVHAYQPDPEDFPVVDEQLDLSSPRPVANSAIAGAIVNLQKAHEATHKAVAELHVTPQMFGAVGDGVVDDTEAIQSAVDSGSDVWLMDGTYLVSDTINISEGVRVFGIGEVTIDFTGGVLFNVSSYYTAPFELHNVKIKANGNQVLEANNGTWGTGFLLDDVTITDANDNCIAMSGAYNSVFSRVIIKGAGTADGTLLKLGTGTESGAFSNQIYFESCAFFANRTTDLIDVGNSFGVKAVNCTFQGFKNAVTGKMDLIGCWFEDGEQCVPSKYDGIVMSPHFANVTNAMPSGVDGAGLHPNAKKTARVIYAESANSVLSSMYDNPVESVEQLNAEGYVNGEYVGERVYKINTNIALYNVPINKIWTTKDNSLLGFKLDGFSKQHIGVFELKAHYFRLTEGEIVQRSYWHGIIKDGAAIPFDTMETNADYPSSLDYDSSNAYLTYGNANGGSSMGWIEFNRLYR